VEGGAGRTLRSVCIRGRQMPLMEFGPFSLGSGRGGEGGRAGLGGGRGGGEQGGREGG